MYKDIRSLYKILSIKLVLIMAVISLVFIYMPHYILANTTDYFKYIIMLLWAVTALCSLLLLISISRKKESRVPHNILNQLKEKFIIEGNSGRLISDRWGGSIYFNTYISKVLHITKIKQNIIEQFKSQNYSCSSERMNQFLSEIRSYSSGQILLYNAENTNNILKVTYVFIGKYILWEMHLDNTYQSSLIDNESIIKEAMSKVSSAILITNLDNKVIFINQLASTIIPDISEDTNLLDFVQIDEPIARYDGSIIILGKILSPNGKDNTVIFVSKEYTFNNNNYCIFTLYQEDYLEILIKKFKPANKVPVISNTSSSQLSVTKLNTYIDILDIAIIELSGDKVMNFNSMAKKIFPNIVKDLIIDTLFIDDFHIIANKIKELGVSHLESVEVHQASSKQYYKVSLYAENNEVIIYLTNITHYKQLETEFTFSQRLQTVGQIASAVAHDFNNLLTAIMSFTHFLHEKFDEDDPEVFELEQIINNSNRAKVMIKQLLTFSRKQQTDPQEVNINDEISDMMSTIMRLIGENIEARFDRSTKLENILIDPVQFAQVMINLVVNARDAMIDGGVLTIKTYVKNVQKAKTLSIGVLPKNTYNVIEIIDEGYGISEENIQKIFTPHFSTKGEKGNGLGLSTVFQILDSNSGYIDVKSVLNKGTTFILYFPIHKSFVSESDEIVLPKTLNHADKTIVYNPTTPMINKDSKQPNLLDLTGSGNILLVEDEAPVRMVCKRVILSRGYNVFEVQNGYEALEFLTKTNDNIDLVLSDVVMPGISGIELITEARKLNKDLKFILMSGYAEDILDNTDIDLGGVEFLPKPFTPDTLSKTIKSILK